MNKDNIYNFFAEKAVLSILLNNPSLIEITKLNLPIEAFYFKNHQQLYIALISLHNNNDAKINLITLTSFLQDQGLLDTIGGLKLVQKLIEKSSDYNYLSEYIRLIKEKFLRRSIIRLGYELINTGYITNINLKSSMLMFEEKLQVLKENINIDSTFDNSSLLNQIFFDLKARSINPEIAGLSSGFYDLDSITQGFQKSDLIIVAGRPSIGKTAFVLNITSTIVKYSKLPVLLFSLEMSREQILYRLIAIETEIGQTRLKNGDLYKDDWVKLNRALGIIRKLPLFVDDNIKVSMSYIRSRIKEIILNQGNLSLLIIDYLQLIKDINLSNENRVQELSVITRSLKIIAKEFNIPVILLSQLNRNIDNRVDKTPILSDLRESGSIEQDADLIILLYKDPTNTTNLNNLINLKIAKHRNGPTGVIQLEFDPISNRFLDL